MQLSAEEENPMRAAREQPLSHHRKQSMHARPYRLSSKRATQVIAAGLTATVVMVGLSYLMGPVSVASPDYASQYGSILISEETTLTNPIWWVGMVMHLALGTFAWSFLYDFLDSRRILFGLDWTPRGAAYGAALWLLNSLVVAPLAGEGTFFNFMFNPVAMSITNLICWLGYGVALAGLVRARMSRINIGLQSEEEQSKWVA